MLKGRKKKTWDKINHTKFSNIPMIEQVLNDKEIKEFKYSRGNGIKMIIMFAILNIIGIYEFVKSPDWIREKPAAAILIGGLLIAGLIFFIVAYYQDKVYIRLTKDEFIYKSNPYPWWAILNMYLRIQYDEYGHHYDLVIEVYGEEKYFSLDSLDSDYNSIIHEVGKYYWNWENRKIKNAT